MMSGAFRQRLRFDARGKLSRSKRFGDRDGLTGQHELAPAAATDPLPPIFLLRFRSRLPLHVVRLVRPAADDGNHAIDHVAGARAVRCTRARACVRELEEDFRVARPLPLRGACRETRCERRDEQHHRAPARRTSCTAIGSVRSCLWMPAAARHSTFSKSMRSTTGNPFR